MRKTRLVMSILIALSLLCTPFSAVQAASAEVRGGIELPMIPGTCSHIMGQWSVTTAATCTQAGVQSRKCTLCSYKESKAVAATGHSFGQWTVTAEPSFTAEGQQQRTCTACGTAQTQSVACLTGKVEHWSIDLQDDLQVNFLLDISSQVEATAQVRVTVGDAEHIRGVSALEKNEEGYYAVSIPAAAAQMTDTITVQVENGADVSESSTYTIRQYADTVLADEDHSQYHALIREMLAYGGAAQTYFGYGTESLASDGITGTGASEIPTQTEEFSVSGSAEDVSFYAASLLYRDKVAVRFYFRVAGDINAYSFTAGETAYTPVLKDGLYYIEIAGITPENLDQQVQVTVTDGNGNAMTVSYGPMNYIVRMNEKGSDSLKALLKALYNYHLAAKALRTAEA